MARIPGGFGVRRPDRSVQHMLDPGMRAQRGEFTDVTSPGYRETAKRAAERGGAMEYASKEESEAAESRAETTRDLAILAIMLTSLPGGVKSAHAQPPIPYGGRGLIGGIDRWEARRRAGMFGNQPLTEGMGFAKPWRRPGWKSPQAIETERHMAPYRSILDSKLDSPAFEAARREIMRREAARTAARGVPRPRQNVRGRQPTAGQERLPLGDRTGRGMRSDYLEAGRRNLPKVRETLRNPPKRRR